MTVIEIREEYDVLDVLGFEQESQTLVEKMGKGLISWLLKIQKLEKLVIFILI